MNQGRAYVDFALKESTPGLPIHQPFHKLRQMTMNGQKEYVMSPKPTDNGQTFLRTPSPLVICTFMYFLYPDSAMFCARELFIWP